MTDEEKEALSAAKYYKTASENLIQKVKAFDLCTSAEIEDFLKGTKTGTLATRQLKRAQHALELWEVAHATDEDAREDY